MTINLSLKYKKYGERLNSQDVFKFIALIIMTIDHIGHYFFPDYLWFRAIGRITFPVWFFLAGYSRNLSFKKDIFWLGVIMIFAKIFLIKTILPFNALITIILIRLLINYMDQKNFNFNDGNKILNVFIICVFTSIPAMLFCEYGTQGLLYGFMGYMVRKGFAKKRSQEIFFAATLVFFLFIQSSQFKFDIYQNIFMCLLTAFVTWKLYNFKINEFTNSWATGAFITVPVKFFARYSLYYYFVHIIIFQFVAGKIIAYERFQNWQWIIH